MSVSSKILEFREKWKELLDEGIISPVIRWNNTKYNERVWSLGEWYTLKIQGMYNSSTCGDTFSTIKAVDANGKYYSLMLYPNGAMSGSVISFFGTKFGGNSSEVWLKVPDNFQIVDTNTKLTTHNFNIDSKVDENRIIVVEGNFGFIVNDYHKLNLDLVGREFINEYGDYLIIDEKDIVLSRGMFLIKNSLVLFEDTKRPNYRELFSRWHPINRKNNRITEADLSKIKLFDRRTNKLAFETTFPYTINKETTYGMPTIEFCYEYDKEIRIQLEERNCFPFYYFYTIKENNKHILVRIKDKYDGSLRGDIYSTLRNQDIYREISSYNHSLVDENTAYLKDGTVLKYNKELNIWTTTCKEEIKFNHPFAYNSMEEILEELENED